MTLRIVRSEDRHPVDFGWLKARHAFSFGDWHDPDRVQFGALRVFNEDHIAPSGAFPPHPHRDYEILTHVFSGALEHQDDGGHRGVIRGGEWQRMTAGTGVVHSEANPSPTEETHLIQVWLQPGRRGLKPGWDTWAPPARWPADAFLPVVSSRGLAQTLSITQDATVWQARPSADAALSLEVGQGRRAYVHIAGAGARLLGQALQPGDTVEAVGESMLTFAADAGATITVFDLA